MKRLRTRLGWRLRRVADRIDPDNEPRCISPYSFTFELYEGIRFRDDGKGCPLWYLTESDHERAWTEANNRPPRIDWETMTLRNPT